MVVPSWDSLDDCDQKHPQNTEREHSKMPQLFGSGPLMLVRKHFGPLVCADKQKCSGWEWLDDAERQSAADRADVDGNDNADRGKESVNNNH